MVDEAVGLPREPEGRCGAMHAGCTQASGDALWCDIVIVRKEAPGRNLALETGRITAAGLSGAAWWEAARGGQKDARIKWLSGCDVLGITPHSEMRIGKPILARLRKDRREDKAAQG